MRNYAAAERQHHPSAAAMALMERGEQAAATERAERYAGLVSIERGPAAYRVRFPCFKERYQDTRPILAAVKAIDGRRFDSLSASWTIPAEQAASVEALALDYGATIAEAPSPDAARIAELMAYIESLEHELERHTACAVA